MRKLIVALAVVALAALGARPAWAHVEVSPLEAAKGSTTTFTFSVANEEDNANTVGVEVVFPDGVSFATVTPEATAGWTATPSATSVKWTGGTISGEDEQKFVVTLGPLPSTDTLVFKALQTYSNGDVVRWIDVQTGDDEPDHPAPTITLTGAAAPSATTPSTASVTTAAVRHAGDRGDDNGATPIVVGALVLVGIGAGIALVAGRRRARGIAD